MSKHLNIDFDLNFLEEERDNYEMNDRWEEELIEEYFNINESPLEDEQDSNFDEVIELNENDKEDLISLDVSLNYILQIKVLGLNLGDNNLTDLMYQAQKLIEHKILFRKEEKRNNKQMTLDEFMSEKHLDIVLKLSR